MKVSFLLLFFNLINASHAFQLPSISHTIRVRSFTESRVRPFIESQQQQSQSHRRSNSIVTYATIEKPTSATTTIASQFLGPPIPFAQLSVGVVRERWPGENRVSQTPESASALINAGFTVLVQSNGMLRVM
jgi:hypothetical protein